MAGAGLGGGEGLGLLRGWEVRGPGSAGWGGGVWKGSTRHSHLLPRCLHGLGFVPGAGWRNGSVAGGELDGQEKEIIPWATRDVSVFVNEAKAHPENEVQDSRAVFVPKSKIHAQVRADRAPSLKGSVRVSQREGT